MDYAGASGTRHHSPHGPSLKERHRQEREELILQTAEAMLLEHGYHDTSLDEIAARVGISKGTIYLHFPSKEDLVLALLERGMRTLLASLDATLSEPGTPREKLQTLLHRVFGTLAGQQFQVLQSLLQSPELASRLAERKQHMAALLQEPARRLAAIFDEGKAAGEFDSSIPTPVLISLFGGLLTPRSYRQLVLHEGMAPEEVERHLCSFFFKGIAIDSIKASANPS